MEEKRPTPIEPSKPGALKWFLGCMAVFIGIPVILCFSFFAYFSIMGFVHRNLPENFTKPMKQEDAQYLYKLLELPETDERCGTTPPYSFSFFPELRKRYKPRVQYQKVEDEIGQYADCNEWRESWSDGTFKHCDYDFTGDGEYTMYISFKKMNDSIPVEAWVWKISVPIIRNYRVSPESDTGRIYDEN